MTRRVSALIASMTLVFAACGNSDDGSGTGAGGTAAEETELTVSAAASLTDAFTEIGDAFEARHEALTVTFNFGPSDGLATQINEGAPVDVFASASGTWMDAVQEEGPGVSGRADFARNRLAIVVPTDNPAGIEDISDLTEDDLQLVIAAEGVPAGDYARVIFASAGISEAALANVVSNAEDVRAVVTAVASGEADAGVVYVTDVTADVADRVTLIEIPDEINVIATYPIAVVTGSQEADLAQGFVDYVLGDGHQILADHGFLPAS
ncbi:MAG: molybdate ABC transporter substrate-binding protein [Actinobacteria bacterium]|nr:molybdate ABC transporter substrate-binding protein [Actinomycetota bacterium]